MAMQAVSMLAVADEAFLVSSLIDRCPKTMMLRELFMNALEAARHAPEGNRFIKIDGIEIDGVDKLVIWNTGPGMSADELLCISDIAASHGKEKSLTGNFGMGAKVASLPSNRHGMRYRSCANGRVHEVILCERDGIYGRLRRFDKDQYAEVIDVTEIVTDGGGEVNYDWTEVVLFGNAPDQDTVLDPYRGDPKQDRQWLATTLYHRFYRLPDDVEISLSGKVNKLKGVRKFKPISARLDRFTRHETVELDGAGKIHFLYDGQYNDTSHNASISGAIASALSNCCIVYKNEMYDLRKGRNWNADAPIFGITFGSKHISVHIEIPDSHPVVPEAYRRFLQWSDGAQDEVKITDFADVVRQSRPQWLIDIISSLAPDSGTNGDIRDELQSLLDQLRVKRLGPTLAAEGQLAVDRGFGAGMSGSEREKGRGERRGEAQNGRPTDLSIMPTGATRASLQRNSERAPEIILLRSEAELDEKGIKGRAARYVMEASQLFVNMNYSSIAEMRAQLESEYAHVEDVEILRSLALQKAEETMIRRVGRTVVYALAKQINNEWDHKALALASSPESLSMAADDYYDSMQNVRRAIGKSLRTKRSDEALDNGVADV